MLLMFIDANMNYMTARVLNLFDSSEEKVNKIKCLDARHGDFGRSGAIFCRQSSPEKLIVRKP